MKAASLKSSSRDGSSTLPTTFRSVIRLESDTTVSLNPCTRCSRKLHTQQVLSFRRCSAAGCKAYLLATPGWENLFRCFEGGRHQRFRLEDRRLPLPFSPSCLLKQGRTSRRQDLFIHLLVCRFSSGAGLHNRNTLTAKCDCRKTTKPLSHPKTPQNPVQLRKSLKPPTPLKFRENFACNAVGATAPEHLCVGPRQGE